MPTTLRRILVVDDEPDMLRLTTAFIEDAFPATKVTGARDGPRALQALAREAADAVVSDYRMPGMHGIELLRRAADHVPRHRRILMTAYPDASLRAEAEREGILFLEKAGDPGNIVDALREIAARRA